MRRRRRTESSTRVGKLADGGDQIKTLQLPVSLVVTHMKQRGTVFFSIFLMAVGCESSAQKETIANLEREVSSLRQERDSLKAQGESHTKEHESIKAEMETLKKPIPAGKKK